MAEEPKSLAELFQRFKDNLGDPLPDDTGCDKCSGFDTTDDRVISILMGRDPTGHLLHAARCKCDERNAEGVSKLTLAAGLPLMVPDGASFENFVDKPGSKMAKDAAIDFVKTGRPHILYMIGPPGTGKTHLMEAIGRAFIAKGSTVRYELVAELLDSMRPQEEGDEEHNIKLAYGARVLLLDDLGLEKPSEWVSEKITSLIDERYRNGRLLVVATNASKKDIERGLGSRLADRLYDKNTNKVRQLWLSGISYRQEKIL